jgi:hypothetical protein
MFDYSLVDYKNSSTPVTLICKKHGPFSITPNKHLCGTGCPICTKECLAEKFRLTQEEFEERGNKRHHGKYDYSKSHYINCDIPVEIICPKHGSFWQTPDRHLYQGSGCPICSTSKGEVIIDSWLKDNGIKFETQKTFDGLVYSKKLRFDFYIPEINLIIEYNGVQHYKYTPYIHECLSDYIEQIDKDNLKKLYLVSHNINYLEISYKDYKDITNLLENKIKEIDPDYLTKLRNNVIIN